MPALSYNVGGFIPVRFLRNLAQGKRPCLVMAVGLKAIAFNQFKVTGVKQLKKMLRADIPVVFEGPEGDTFGEEPIPLERAQMVLKKFTIEAGLHNQFYVLGEIELSEENALDLSSLEWLKDASPDDYVALNPRLLQTTLKTLSGNVHFLEDIGGVLVPPTFYTRQELLEAGYKGALYEYEKYAGIGEG